MRKVKKIVSYIIACILAILLAAYLIITILSSTIMSKSYIISKFEQIGYFHKMDDLLQSNFEKYTQQSGFEENVVKGLVTEDKLRDDTKQILINLFDRINDEISTKEIEDKLRENIDKSLNGRTLSNEEQKAVDKFIVKITDEYKATILNTKYEQTINTYYLKLEKYINMASKALIVAIGILGISLVLISPRRIYRAFNALGVAALAGGAILVIFNLYITLNIDLNLITLMNEVFSEALRKILTDIFGKIGIYGLISSILGLILIVLSNLFHNIKKYGTTKKYKKGHHSDSKNDDEFEENTEE